MIITAGKHLQPIKIIYTKLKEYKEEITKQFLYQFSFSLSPLEALHIMIQIFAVFVYEPTNTESVFGL